MSALDAGRFEIDVACKALNTRNALYADQGNWPERQQQKWAIKPEVTDFITKAMRSKG